MSQYEALADSYDRLMADAAHRRRAAFLERFLRGKSVHTVLDLGCGTGTIACMLAQRGYQVIATVLNIPDTVGPCGLPPPKPFPSRSRQSLLCPPPPWRPDGRR